MKDSGIEWIGEIPEDWEVSKGKYLYIRNDGGIWGVDCDENKGYIVLRSTEQLADGTLQIANPAVRGLSKKEFANTKLIEGDIIITKSSGSMAHIGKASYVTDLIESMNCSFSNFMQRIRFKGPYPKYYWYVINSIIVREQFNYLSTTTTGLNNISAEMLREIIIPSPPLYIQKAIANYLDEKVAKIDHIIEKTKESIEEYKKYKQSLITETVTKGLNPNVEMKDSGIEWIGEIPEHWKITKSKFLYDIVLGKMLCTKQIDNSYTLENYLCAQNIKWEGISTKEIKQMWFSPREKKQYLLKYGDVVVVEGGDIGVSSVYKGEAKPCCIQNAVHKVSSKGNSLNKLFYYWMTVVVSSGYLDTICNKATIRHYTKEKLENTPILFIPVREQCEIVSYLDKKCSKINNLITQKEQLLTELESYKKSLIYEYVTGKKQVV